MNAIILSVVIYIAIFVTLSLFKMSAEINLLLEDKDEDSSVYEETVKQKPCEDAISRQVVKEQMIKYGFHAPDMTVTEFIEDLPPVTPQSNMEQFAKWVATEIFDDNWEYNKDAFDELACRKLAKLGIVRVKGDEYELVESQEGEEV